MYDQNHRYRIMDVHHMNFYCIFYGFIMLILIMVMNNIVNYNQVLLILENI
jgi:hypothetical protein